MIGAALLGTFQVVREKFHSSMIVEHLTLLDPRVAARVQSGGSAWVAKLANTGVIPTEGATWTILAQKGDTGPTGPPASDP